MANSHGDPLFTNYYDVIVCGCITLCYTVCGDNMGIEKKVVSMRLDEDFIEKLKEIAETQNRTLSNLIETVLKEYVARLMQDN